MQRQRTSIHHPPRRRCGGAAAGAAASSRGPAPPRPTRPTACAGRDLDMDPISREVVIQSGVSGSGWPFYLDRALLLSGSFHWLSSLESGLVPLPGANVRVAIGMRREVAIVRTGASHCGDCLLYVKLGRSSVCQCGDEILCGAVPACLQPFGLIGWKNAPSFATRMASSAPASGSGSEPSRRHLKMRKQRAAEGLPAAPRADKQRRRQQQRQRRGAGAEH